MIDTYHYSPTLYCPDGSADGGHSGVCFGAYNCDNVRYVCDRIASNVTIKPITPAMVNRSASPRSAPVPNQLPMSFTPSPVVMNGMKTNCAIGPIKNAVIGDAACSMLWAKPNTRP